MVSKYDDVIIGIGSPHGDDVAGWLVADAFASRVSANVAAVRVADATGILTHLSSDARIWIADACRSGESPGTVRRWQWPELPTISQRNPSTHALGLAEVLQLAANLKLIPAQVVIYTIEMDEASLKDRKISTAVQAAIPRVVERLRNDIVGTCDESAHQSRNTAQRSLDEVDDA